MITVEKGKNPENFTWITKTKFYGRSADTTSDISIGLSTGPKAHPEKTRVAIHFRNYTMKKFNSEYVMLGIDGDRLYFADADKYTGYKITTQTDGRLGVLQVTDDNLREWARNHIGDSRLYQDSKSGLYYAQIGKLV